jgi:Methyltransferase domain
VTGTATRVLRSCHETVTGGRFSLLALLFRGDMSRCRATGFRPVADSIAPPALHMRCGAATVALVRGVAVFEGELRGPLRLRGVHTVGLNAARVRKLTGKTRDVLPGLINEGARFDFVYIDASHNALDVLAGAALAWQLLDRGGLIAFDDYGLDRGDPMLTPTTAIDAFLAVVASEAERVPGGRQLFVRKRSG